jgi:hypothetical protein
MARGKSLGNRDNRSTKTSGASGQGPSARRSDSNPSPRTPAKTHGVSNPKVNGPLHSDGGATFAVQDNANVRADKFLNPPTKNSSPATRRTFPPSN